MKDIPLSEIIWKENKSKGMTDYLYPENMQGHFFSMFIIGIAAAEAAVAIAIIINIYRNIQNIDVENIDQMKY